MGDGRGMLQCVLTAWASMATDLDSRRAVPPPPWAALLALREVCQWGEKGVKAVVQLVEVLMCSHSQ